MKAMDKDLRAEQRATNQRLVEEEAERRKAVESVESKVEEATVGGIDLSLSGVFCIAMGIVLASAPDGAAHWLAALRSCLSI